MVQDSTSLHQLVQKKRLTQVLMGQPQAGQSGKPRENRGKQGRLYRACNILRSFDFVSASRRTLRSGWICFLGVQAKQTPRPSERRLDVSCQAVVEDCHGLVTSFNPSTPLQDQAHRLRAGWDDGLLGVAGKDNHAHLSARLHLGNDSGGQARLRPLDFPKNDFQRAPSESGQAPSESGQAGNNGYSTRPSSSVIID